MMEYQEITKDNLAEVLVNSGYREVSISPWDNDFSNGIFRIKWDNHRSFIYIEKDTNSIFSIHANYINSEAMFILFTELLGLKPLSKEPEFDFEKYLLDNGFTMGKVYGRSYLQSGPVELWGNPIKDSTLRLYVRKVEYEEISESSIPILITKENADKLIAAAKLLSKLKGE